MKMTPEHFDLLQRSMRPTLEAYPSCLNSMRGMWNAFFKLPDDVRRPFLYAPGYKDAHMETAFRRIMAA